MDDLRTIVSAGMSVSEARLLLDEGYDPADVLELAQMQAQKTKDAATDAQTATARAMQKAMRPENERHPGLSVFSHPDGDLKKPKDGLLKYEVWYLNYPMHMFPETETWRELELVAQVEPGEYTIVRKDRSTMRMEVTCERDGFGKISRLFIGLPKDGRIDRQDKWLLPAKTVVLYQMIHHAAGTPQQVYLRAMQEYLAQEIEAEVLSA